MTFFRGKPRQVRRANPNVVKDPTNRYQVKPADKPVEKPVMTKNQE